MAKVWLKHTGTWKEPTKLFVKTGGVWKDPLGGWTNVAGTWQKFYPQADPALTLDLDFISTPTLDPRITFSRASTATYYNASGVLSTAATNVPRFDYDPVTHVAKGLLIEEQRVNPLQQVQDFTNVSFWTKAGCTALADQTVSPDGTTTADQITASATPATIEQGTTITSVAYTQSVYAKKGTSDWCYLCAKITGTGAQTPKAYFNLATGVVGTVEAGITAATIQNVGNGWYRCTIASVGTAGTEFFQAGICDADNSAAVTVGRTIFLWGAQSELGAFATSYMPSGASAFTRAADVAVMTGTAFSSWYNQPAGTFVAEFDVFATGAIRVVSCADNATSTEVIQLWVDGARQPRMLVQDNNVTQFSGSVIATITAGTVNKFGISYALNDFAGCSNGGTVITDTAGTLPTPTQLRLGTDGTSTTILTGHLRRIRFYNVAKSDADLQALTT
jgi:hypothetical protein